MKKRRGTLYFSMCIMTIVPLIAFGIIVTIFSSKHSTDVAYAEVKQELEKVADSVMTSYDYFCPGEITVNEKELKLYKGTKLISEDTQYVDNIKKETNLDISIFYDNKRYLTTLHNDSGSRAINTEARKRVYNSVFDEGEGMFYEEVTINDDVYFAYYKPIKDGQGKVIGMVGIAKSSDDVKELLHKSSTPIILLSFLSMIVAGVISVGYTKSIIDYLRKINKHLEKVKSGNVSYKMSEKLLGRRDQLGEISRSIETMQTSLREYVEQDALTGLLNRRTGEKMVNASYKKYISSHEPLIIAIGDIDFFKKVNDTYGHEAGDIVLKSISEILKSHMKNVGYVCRWGGEEYLLVFDACTGEATRDILSSIRIDIMKQEIIIGSDIVKVTMTFGVASADEADGYLDAIAKADERLYKGKQNGRNCVVN